MTEIPADQEFGAGVLLDAMIGDVKRGVNPDVGNLFDYVTGLLPDVQNWGVLLAVALQRLAYAHDRTDAADLVGYGQVRAKFTQYWDESLFDGWMNNANVYLNHATPTQFLQCGDVQQVLDAIESGAHGAYS